MNRERMRPSPDKFHLNDPEKTTANEPGIREKADSTGQARINANKKCDRFAKEKEEGLFCKNLEATNFTNGHEWENRNTKNKSQKERSVIR